MFNVGNDLFKFNQHVYKQIIVTLLTVHLFYKNICYEHYKKIYKVLMVVIYSYFI